MNAISSAIIIFALIFVAACDKKKNVPPLPGERLEVIKSDSIINSDPSQENVIIKLPAPQRQKSWTQVASNGAHLLPNIDFPNLENRRKIWSVKIAGNSGSNFITSEPLVVNDVLYVLDTRGQVLAFNALNGTKLWEKSVVEKITQAQGTVGGGLAYDEGKIFATTAEGKVFALDAQNGEVIWSEDFDVPMRSAPIAAEGRVFVITVDNTIQALDSKSGTKLWWHAGIPESTIMVGSASPAIAHKSVIVPYSSGEVYSLQADNGAILWTKSIGNGKSTDAVSQITQIRANPVISDNTVTIVSQSGKIMVINLINGLTKWERDIGGSTTPIIAGGYIFLTTNNERFMCINRDNGAIKWVSEPPILDAKKKPEYSFWGSMMLINNGLFVANSKGQILRIDPQNGAILQSSNEKIPTSVLPVVVDHRMYILMENGTLSAWE